MDGQNALKYPMPCPSIIAPCNMPNTAVLLMGSTTSPAMMFTTRLCSVSVCLCTYITPTNNNLHVASWPSKNSNQLSCLNDHHACSPPCYHAQDLSEDANGRNKGLHHECQSWTKFLGHPSRNEEIKSPYQVELITPADKPSFVNLTTEGCAHAQNTELRGSPRRNLIPAASISRSLKWGMSVVEYITFHKMEYIEEPTHFNVNSFASPTETGLSTHGT